MLVHADGHPLHRQRTWYYAQTVYDDTFSTGTYISSNAVDSRLPNTVSVI